MRVMSDDRVAGFGISLAPILIFGTLILVFCMAILVIIRTKCINEGYKINELALELDRKSLKYEAVAKRYSDALRWETLFNKAGQMDFIFPEGGKVFYVQK